LLLTIGLEPWQVLAQCLSSVNPVGGTENLLVLEKNTLRIIVFYKYSQGRQYFHGNKHDDYDLIDRAFYSNLSLFAGYGLTNRLALETEQGYFINKTQVYNTDPEYRLRGYGLSNLVLSLRYSLFADHFKRVFITVAPGIKIPASRKPQTVDHVELPVEVQPTMGSYGLVLSSTLVKENSGRGLRFFLTNRTEWHFVNKKEYRPGTAMYTSVYLSKHIMHNRVKGDWTAILQLRHEFRTHDIISGKTKEFSGGTLLFVVPQINHMVAEKWNFTALADIPVFQYFNGTQLGAGFGVTFSVSRTFSLSTQKQ
jgi:hypothetical protein